MLDLGGMETANTSAARGDVPTGRPAIDLSVAIRRSPSAIFALLADIQESEPIPRNASVRMVKDPAGPTMIGTCWHEWVKVAPRYWLHVESVVTEVNPPYRLGMDYSGRWLTGHLTYDIEQAADGSILHQRETLRTRAVLRWLSPFIERRLRPRLVQRLLEIKAILEESADDEANLVTSPN